MNSLVEFKKRVIASVLSEGRLPGPAVTFIRAQVLGERSSRTSGEINAEYTAGGIGYWPVWDKRPELSDFHECWFLFRSRSPISLSETEVLAKRFGKSLAEVLAFTDMVEDNLERFAADSAFVPVVAMVPEEDGHFLFEKSGKLLETFMGWELPEFSIREWDSNVDRWSWITRFGVLIPDVLAPIVEDSTVIYRVGEAISDDVVVAWLQAAETNVDELVVFELAMDSMSSGDRFDEWGVAETRMMKIYSRIINNVTELALAYGK